MVSPVTGRAEGSDLSGTEAPQEGAIETRGLTKSFVHTWALRGVDLTVKKGEFLTLLGPNGAGKTTMLRILAGLSRPTTGTVLVDGLSLSDEPIELRRRIGVISHQTLLYDDLTVEENLRFYGRMYDVPDLTARVARAMELLAIAHRRHDRVRTLSRGLQQRASIARAILHDPAILLLDEPDTGLDQYASSVLKRLLEDLKTEERTIIMTTHNLERGLELADRVAILVHGKVVFDRKKETGDVAALRSAYLHYAGERG